MPRASSPFDQDDIDLVIRTKDVVTFHVYCLIVALGSNLCKNLPPPSSSPTSTFPIIMVPEDSETLDAFLRVCYPFPDPEVMSPSLVRKVLAAGIKYEAPAVVASMKMMLLRSHSFENYPTRVLAIACQLVNEAEAKVGEDLQAALEKHVPDESSNSPWLGDTTAGDSPRPMIQPDHSGRENVLRGSSTYSADEFVIIGSFCAASIELQKGSTFAIEHRAHLPLVAKLTPSEKLHQVEESMRRELIVGETWYIVLRRWFTQWRNAMSGEASDRFGLNEEDIGVVNNTNLCNVHGEITSSLIEHIDCEFVPMDTWKLFEEWYGVSKAPLGRKVIERGILKERSLELRPPKFRVHMLVPITVPGKDTKAKTATVYSMSKISDACKAFAETVASDKAATCPYRIWKISSNAGSEETFFSANSLSKCGAILVDSGQGTVEEEFTDPGEEFIVEFMTPVYQWVVDAPHISATPAPPQTKSEPFLAPDFFSKLERTIGPRT